MTIKRYMELSKNPELNLTEEEFNAGWYFSFEWDEMLIHISWPEHTGKEDSLNIEELTHD